MPLHVLDAVDSLTFETKDGGVHGLSSSGSPPCFAPNSDVPAIPTCPQFRRAHKSEPPCDSAHMHCAPGELIAGYSLTALAGSPGSSGDAQPELTFTTQRGNLIRVTTATATFVPHSGAPTASASACSQHATSRSALY